MNLIAVSRQSNSSGSTYSGGPDQRRSAQLRCPNRAVAWQATAAAQSHEWRYERSDTETSDAGLCPNSVPTLSRQLGPSLSRLIPSGPAFPTPAPCDQDGGAERDGAGLEERSSTCLVMRRSGVRISSQALVQRHFLTSVPVWIGGRRVVGTGVDPVTPRLSAPRHGVAPAAWPTAPRSQLVCPRNCSDRGPSALKKSPVWHPCENSTVADGGRARARATTPAWKGSSKPKAIRTGVFTSERAWVTASLAAKTSTDA